MDSLKAFGINTILAIQNTFDGYEVFFSLINRISDPNNVIYYLFPFLSIFDSLFATELLSVAALSNWFNGILKWALYEDRPYWWVRETDYYKENYMTRPKIHTNFQSCETGPGNPSGNVMSITGLLTLFTIWIIAIRGRDFCTRRDRMSIYSMCAIFFTTITLTSMSRMYIGAQFPHQCMIGAVLGVLVTHFLVKYFHDPFIDLDLYRDTQKKAYLKILRNQILTNVTFALCAIIIPVLIYWGMKSFDVDPVYSIKLAFKWCPSPNYLHYSSTPFFSFVLSSGSLLGWSLCVTPTVKSYRYHTKERSLLIATLSAIMFHQIFQQWHDSIAKDNASTFYIIHLFISTLRPFFFVRVVPFLSTCKNKWHATKTKVENKTTECMKKKRN